MKQVFQGIYHIVNRANGKGYVGQSVDIHRRWKKEISDSKKSKNISYFYPLQGAFRKYGIENFTFTIVELVEDKNNLTEREIYYYEKLDSSYNQKIPTDTCGFYKTSRNKPIIQISFSGEIIKEYISINEASRKNMKSTNRIRQACNDKDLGTIGNFYWIYKEDYEEKKQKIEKYTTLYNKLTKRAN